MVIEGTCAVMLHMLKYIPGIQALHNEAADIGAYPLVYVPDKFKTQEMCIKAVKEDPWQLHYVPDQYKTQEMCNEAVCKEPYMLYYVPDQYKAQEICDAAVHRKLWLLEYVTDWFVTQQQLKLWDDHCDDGVIIKWHNGYQKRKAQKIQTEKEVMIIAWHHHDGGIGVFLKTRKKRQKHYGHEYGLFCVW